MRYLVQAQSGRKVGAIGCFYPIATFVEADNAEAALIAAYDKIEHLTLPKVEPEDTASLDGARELIE